VKLPYVDATRYFRQNPDSPNGPIGESHIQGIAILATVGTTETLSVGSLRFEFDDDILFGCKQ
jgi:hypothetical protein